MPGLLAGSSDWSFTLRTTCNDSDTDDDDVRGGKGSDIRLLKDLDLSAREDTAQFKPNPWAIAKMNAACRRPNASAGALSKNPADLPKLKEGEKPRQSTLAQAFLKQASSRGQTNYLRHSGKNITSKKALTHVFRGTESSQSRINPKLEHHKADHAELPPSTSMKSFISRKPVVRLNSTSLPGRLESTPLSYSTSNDRLQDTHRPLPSIQHTANNPILQGISEKHVALPIEKSPVMTGIFNACPSTTNPHIHSQISSKSPQAATFHIPVQSLEPEQKSSNEVNSVAQTLLLDTDDTEFDNEQTIQSEHRSPRFVPVRQGGHRSFQCSPEIEVSGVIEPGMPLCTPPPSDRPLPFKAFTPMRPTSNKHTPMVTIAPPSHRLPQKRFSFVSSPYEPLSAVSPSPSNSLQVPPRPVSYHQIRHAAIPYGSPIKYNYPITPDRSFSKPEHLEARASASTLGPNPPMTANAGNYHSPVPSRPLTSQFSQEIFTLSSPSPPQRNRTPVTPLGSRLTGGSASTQRPTVTAYGSLTDPDEDAWTTLPVRKKRRSDASHGSGMMKTGKFMLPISMPHRMGRKSSQAKTRNVTLYKPPPAGETENERREVAILKLRRVGREEAADLGAIEKSMTRAKHNNLEGRNAGCEWTDGGRKAPVHGSDLTMAESSPPTASPLSFPSPNVPVSLSRLGAKYPATRQAISEVRWHLVELGY